MTAAEKAAKMELAKVGVDLKIDREWDEYQVYPVGLTAERREAVKYHTDDLEDAVSTGKVMAQQVKEGED